MLDIKFIRENKELVAQNNAARKVTVDLSELLELDSEKLKLQQKIDELRAERNKRSKIKPSEEEILLTRKIGDEISGLEEILAVKTASFNTLLAQLPNLTHPAVPVGTDETGNKVLRRSGEPTNFTFKPQNHLALGERLGIIDVVTAAKVSGSRFYYLKGRLVQLQFALIQYVLNIVTNADALQAIISKNNLTVSAKPFIPVLPPLFIRPEVMQKMGRLEPREERYHIESDDLYLIGSAEHTLGPMYLDKTIPEADLPLRFAGYSTAFRREAGSYGKDTHGILRVHQFDKLELESFTIPEHSEAEQDLLVAIQEHITQALGLPYQVVLICTGDMGTPDYRQIDIETWLPGEQRYRETHSADLTADYQTRRLNTRVKKADGKIDFIHLNDATAFAGRTLIAILENYQELDGTVTVPQVLRSYCGFDRIE